MATPSSSLATERAAAEKSAGFRVSAVPVVHNAMEILILAMVVLAPWLFGSTESLFEFILFCCVAVLLLLWGLRMVLERQFVWKKCPVIVCLTVLFLIGI